MRRIIHSYEGVMVSKILACKTTLSVLDVIDKTINLIRKKTDEQTMIYKFVESSLLNLRHINEKNMDPMQFSKIRSAISHLDNLRMHYKIF